jgi:succinate-semialdehyde dehydrogenase/glutarate-semialdehyde dehydrogenase
MSLVRNNLIMSTESVKLTCTSEPSTATVLGQVANCALEDFQTAIKSADAAQTKYFDSTTGASRGALLRKWYDLVLANQEDRT